MADWRDLPPELLALTAKRLNSVSDYTSFLRVCKSWRSVATFDDDCPFPPVPRLIFLVLKKDEQFKKSVPVRVPKFTSLSNTKIFRNIGRCLKNSRNYYLSCKGWLLGVARRGARLRLMHLIRPNRIKLPDLETPHGFLMAISKMVFSGSPTMVSDLVIMVIYGAKKQLGFSRSGDSRWTLMEQWDGSFTDILYHKGRLYAIDVKCRVVVCDIHGSNPTQMQQILCIPGFDHVVAGREFYMVESSGKILIVHGFCQVFEFDLMGGSHKEIYDLGNRAMFLSRNSSSLSLEGFAWKEVEPNCIYRADTLWCYNMGSRVSRSLFVPDFMMAGFLPTWVVPGF